MPLINITYLCSTSTVPFLILINRLKSGYIHRLAQGGDTGLFEKAKLKAMKDWSYNGLWWIRHTETGNKVIARGAHGQFLYIDPMAEIVIARFASTEQASSYLKDNINMPLFDIAVKHIEDKLKNN